MHKIAIPQAAIDRVLKRRDSLHVFNELEHNVAEDRQAQLRRSLQIDLPPEYPLGAYWSAGITRGEARCRIGQPQSRRRED